MSRRNQLRQEAAQVRRRIDRHAWLIRQRIDGLMQQAGVLARSPAALPVAFVCGILAGRLPVPAINRAFGVLAGLAGQVKAMQIAYSHMGSPVR